MRGGETMIPELSLKDGRMKKYRRMGGVLLTIFFVLFGSLFFYSGNEKDKGVKIGEDIEQGQNVVQLVEANYYEDQELLQLGVYFKVNKIDPLDPIQPVVQKTKNMLSKLDVKVEKITDDYYQLFVKSVKKDRDFVLAVMYTKSEQKSLISGSELFPVSVKKANHQKKFQPKTEEAYLKTLYVFLEKEAQKEAKKSEATIRKARQDIKILEAANQEMKEHLSLKTSEQRTTDEGKISQNQSKIRSLIQSIEEEQKRVEEQEKMMVQYQKLAKKLKEK
ncbi:hypothetical protein H6228_002532 [Enterococcus faecalis]|nr:hypothetical protein [Enterococcus faecalis]EGO5076991.1 hypothetical protein [Enterococcus faecalis]